MLNFNFEIANGRNGQEVSGFARGYMTIVGSCGKGTSKSKEPDQSMMIFLSIIELLDGVRRFLSNESESTYNFVGVDSSFQFTANKDADDCITLLVEGTVIDAITPDEMVHAIWNGVAPFVTRHISNLNAETAVVADLDSSTRDFARRFDLSPMR